MYTIQTKRGSNLSYWYSGDLQSRKHIIGSRKNDWWAFKSKEEAESKIAFMLSEVPRNAERWGEEITRQVEIYIKNLVVRTI